MSLVQTSPAHIPLLQATSAFGLGRRRWSSPRQCYLQCLHQHTHTRLMALFPGLPGSAGTRKVKPIWILLKQETVSGSGITWAMCKSAPRSRPITTPAPHHSVFYRPDALPVAQPTVSKHWRHTVSTNSTNKTSYRAERRYAPADRGGSTSVRRLIRSPHSSGSLA